MLTAAVPGAARVVAGSVEVAVDAGAVCPRVVHAVGGAGVGGFLDVAEHAVGAGPGGPQPGGEQSGVVGGGEVEQAGQPCKKRDQLVVGQFEAKICSGVEQ